MDNQIQWLQSSETSFVGYVKEKPVFSMQKINEHTWSAFLSYRGTIYDTFDKCRQWCEFGDQMRLANELLQLFEKREKGGVQG